MTQYVLTTPGLDRETALFLTSMLDEAVHPMAHATSCNCVNEASDLWALEAYFDDKPAASDFEHLIADTSLKVSDITIKPVEQKNWVEESLKGLSPVHAGRYFVHGTHDRAARPRTATCIEIDAGIAFGTGHHGTTTGCLLALDYLVNSQTIRSVLDVGCGTGVLAIAAAKTLKVPTIASDIDPVAVDVTKQNAIANDVAPFITTLPATGIDHNTIKNTVPYDLIFANILAGPLVSLAPDIAPLISKTGHVVLSGLNCNQERWVYAAWRAQGLVLKKRYRLDNWTTLVLGYPAKPTHKKAQHVDRTGQLLIAEWLGRRFTK